MGLTNVEVMVPFVRTVEEAEQVVELLAANGLERGEDGLQGHHDVRDPDQRAAGRPFLEHFDGISIGSNDMTQLTLGLDRDSAIDRARCSTSATTAVKAHAARWRSRPAARPASTSASAARGRRTTRTSRGGCWSEGIESMSLNPDTVVETWLFLADPKATGPAVAAADQGRVQGRVSGPVLARERNMRA